MIVVNEERLGKHSHGRFESSMVLVLDDHCCRECTSHTVVADPVVSAEIEPLVSLRCGSWHNLLLEYLF